MMRPHAIPGILAWGVLIFILHCGSLLATALQCSAT